MTTKFAPKATLEVSAFFKNAVIKESPKYPRLCLKAQRTGRGLPAVYPTALSAALATPVNERVDFDVAKPGMVGYSYDARIPGTAGHIFYIEKITPSGLITCTNDAFELGVMDYVPLSFYKEHWGHTLQFAAGWLNGYDFKDFNAPPKDTFGGGLGEKYENAIEVIKDVRNQKAKKYGKDAPIVKALNKDIARMKKRLVRFNEAQSN